MEYLRDFADFITQRNQWWRREMLALWLRLLYIAVRNSGLKAWGIYENDVSLVRNTGVFFAFSCVD